MLLSCCIKIRAATGVLSNIDHQNKTEYQPNIDHTALYRPNIDRKSSLKSAHLHKKTNIDQISTTQHFIDQISTAKFT